MNSDTPADGIYADRTTPDGAAATPDGAAATPAGGGLEVHLYQIAADDTFAANRTDGSGWTWSWADWKRQWMEETANKFAYRCLPLTIANQTGWIVNNPVGFTAYWNGGVGSGSVHCVFDQEPGLWSKWVTDHFGNGILTWNTPFLFRTAPAESRLLVMGPANHFKHGVAPLTAIIESDWMNMSFTMNWKITLPGVPVRFEVGEPIFQVIPMAANVCADLERATVTYRRLQDDATVHAAYLKWQESRNEFHRRKAAGEVKADAWQKDYFQGKDMLGRPVTSGHTTRVTPPAVRFESTSPPPSPLGRAVPDAK